MHLFAIAMVLFSSTASAATITLTCPDNIQTKQTLITPVPGWHISVDRSTTVDGKLHGGVIGFSDGPPEQLATLAPDSTTPSKTDKDRFVNRWTFGESEKSWQICTYTGTLIQLSKPLPARITSCSIEYEHSADPVRAWCEQALPSP